MQRMSPSSIQASAQVAPLREDVKQPLGTLVTNVPVTDLDESESSWHHQIWHK